jgi:hypothetical protein
MLGEEALRQIREVIREYAHRYWNDRPDKGRWTQTQADYYAKLNADLAAATGSNFSTSSCPSASCSVWQANGSGGIEDSTRDVTVKNRSDIAYTSGTHGIVRWIGGEWVFFGNCNPF